MTQAVRLAAAWLTVTLFLLFGKSWVADPIVPVTAGLLFVWLFAVMVWSAFGALKVADKLAETLGEPLGSLVLTLTIIGLEGVLIATAILTSDAAATIGRDTLLGANMIMINLAGGLALFLGGWRHREQTYNFQGTSAYLAVVITLCTLAFILPNYTAAKPTGSVTTVQAVGIIAVTVGIYVTFLLLQIGRHKHFFVEPDPASNVRAELAHTPDAGGAAPRPDGAGAGAGKGGIGGLTLLLLAGVVPVLLLGKFLTTILDHASNKLGTPSALGGVVIALIVVSPKLISAIKAGLADEPQRAINLAMGSCAPAMGVILPIILVIGLVTGQMIIMGVSPSEVILLALTLVLAALTYSGPRTTLLEGAAHLAIFVVYVVLMFSP